MGISWETGDCTAKPGKEHNLSVNARQEFGNAAREMPLNFAQSRLSALKGPEQDSFLRQGHLRKNGFPLCLCVSVVDFGFLTDAKAQ
jgi:hypothetical protein